MTDDHDHARPDGEPEPEQPEPEDEHDHARPGRADQLAALAAYHAILTGASSEVQHHAASSGDCPACTAVAAAWFGVTLAKELAGAGFVNGPLAPQVLKLIAEAEAELRRAAG